MKTEEAEDLCKDMNDRQILFCHEYLNTGFNITQSAKNAGYSEKTAHVQGSRLLKNAKVRTYIDSIVDKILGEKKNILKIRVLNELEKIAFADVTKDVQVETVKGEGGKIEKHVNIVDTKESQNKTAIASISRNSKGYIEVKYYDKPRALEMLGKYLEIFTEKIDATVRTAIVTMEDLLEETEN